MDETMYEVYPASRARTMSARKTWQYLLVQYRDGEEKLSLLNAVNAGELLISGSYKPEQGDRLFKLGEEYTVNVTLAQLNPTTYR